MCIRDRLKESEALVGKLRDEGKEVVPFLVGRKSVSCYRFRHREYAASWEESTDNPSYETAKKISDRILEEFLTEGEAGVDEVHIAVSYTHLDVYKRQPSTCAMPSPASVTRPTSSRVAASGS